MKRTIRILGKDKGFLWAASAQCRSRLGEGRIQKLRRCHTLSPSPELLSWFRSQVDVKSFDDWLCTHNRKMAWVLHGGNQIFIKMQQFPQEERVGGASELMVM